jgi:orotidine-5'-phosphate decarboxylase
MISSKVIIALDFSERQQVLDLVSGLDPQECRLKVGKELFTSYGPQIVRELQALGFEIFLDLKFNPTPLITNGQT